MDYFSRELRPKCTTLCKQGSRGVLGINSKEYVILFTIFSLVYIDADKRSLSSEGTVSEENARAHSSNAHLSASVAKAVTEAW